MQRKKILIVDDEEMVREVVGDALVSEFNVFEASNGVEALELLSKNLAPQLIITDYNMPRMNGREFIKSLRENYSDVPVICLTGQGNKDIHLDMWMKGVFEYIEKPFDPTSLLAKAKTAIELKADLVKESQFRKLAKKTDDDFHIELSKNLNFDIKTAALEKGLSVSSYVEEVLKEVVSTGKRPAE